MAKTVEKIRKRTDAFAQLKRAQKMLTDGKMKLEAAQAQINEAQTLIDSSAAVLRAGWAAPNQTPTRSSRVRAR